ncbi:S-adenosyl-L-methionine-dependent methyltransferase [Ampelomyces quisqualis]|uniref:S-adenosyl-L-methionine-dependent methyltransferase n=1 Tax=Ampelomyces quisqualis TaxID=50730 RepID=A0A6A5R2Y6_AMPQU|nr:S-adenosyl-L-methionine-dependent methyltransferase [Ampelomyces quisqualis]
MTQPTSVNMTFDTSLVDLNPNSSFSTTESDPSDIGASTTKTPTMKQSTPPQTIQSNLTPLPTESSAPVQIIKTQEAYDQWASVYDSDGNMLQAIDDIELSSSHLLSDFFDRVQMKAAAGTVLLLDLGCGTGRNTAKLLDLAMQVDRSHTLLGLDFSAHMLSAAAKKLQPCNVGPKRIRLRLESCNCFPTADNPSEDPVPFVVRCIPEPIHGVISTLVLEHVPLKAFFATLSALLQHGGFALVTNMHPDMGASSQAGFVNKDGVKIRGSSFVHTVEDTVKEARSAGFHVLETREREMKMEDVESGAVGERGRKWIGTKVWFGLVLVK